MSASPRWSEENYRRRRGGRAQAARRGRPRPNRRGWGAAETAAARASIREEERSGALCGRAPPRGRERACAHQTGSCSPGLHGRDNLKGGPASVRNPRARTAAVTRQCFGGINSAACRRSCSEICASFIRDVLFSAPFLVTRPAGASCQTLRSSLVYRVCDRTRRHGDGAIHSTRRRMLSCTACSSSSVDSRSRAKHKARQCASTKCRQRDAHTQYSSKVPHAADQSVHTAMRATGSHGEPRGATGSHGEPRGAAVSRGEPRPAAAS